MGLFADLLSGAGYVLDTPGALTRGAIGNIADLITGEDKVGARISGRDLLERLGILGSNQEGLDAGDVVGFLTEMLLDPTNLLPPLAFGKLAKAAKAAGPRYATKLSDIIGGGRSEILSGANVDDVLRYIPPGSAMLGRGNDADAFVTPASRVLRISGGPPGLEDMEGRYISKHILQPSHQVSVPITVNPSTDVPRKVVNFEQGSIPHGFGHSSWHSDEAAREAFEAASGRTSDQWPSSVFAPDQGPITDLEGRLVIENTPRIQTAKEAQRLAPENTPAIEAHGSALREALAGDGVQWTDDHFDNFGYMGGSPIVLDPGYMYPIEGMTPPPKSQFTRHAGMGPVKSRLADMLGYTTMVRKQWEGLPATSPTRRNALLSTLLYQGAANSLPGGVSNGNPR